MLPQHSVPPRAPAPHFELCVEPFLRHSSPQRRGKGTVKHLYRQRAILHVDWGFCSDQPLPKALSLADSRTQQW